MKPITKNTQKSQTAELGDTQDKIKENKSRYEDLALQEINQAKRKNMSTAELLKKHGILTDNANHDLSGATSPSANPSDLNCGFGNS